MYGARDEKRGYSLLAGNGNRVLHPRTSVTTGVLAAPCSRLVKDFFKKLRD